jgi:dUTP pyrophosphatase
MKIEIAFRDDAVRKLYAAAGVQTDGSAGFDLVSTEDVFFEACGDFKIIDLGVVIRVPQGCHSLLMPRSSTFVRYRIMQANSVGLIDHDYCGAEDWWGLPAVYLGQKPLELPRGTRLAQFILQKTLPIDCVEEFLPENNSRGGLGSTGK